MGKTVAAVVAVVAVIAIAVAAPYLAPGVVAAFGSIGITISTAVATALVTATLSIAVSLAFSSLGVGAPSATNQVGPPQVFRQSISNSFIVYGRRRVGGLMAFFHAKQGASGAHFRYFVIACAGHQCLQLVSWMLNDKTVTVDGSGMVTSGDYANAAWLWFERGTPTDAANATFVSECDGMWTSAHQGKGVAKIYAKFQLTDAVVQAGMPNITAVIDGRDEIRDSRTGTTGFTNNGPLVFYDWMAMPREEGGFGAYSDEIPDDTWVSAQANVADEVVSGEARYALDGVITTGATPSEVRDALVVNMAGTYAYSGGVHLMRPGYWVPPSATLSEDDLAGPIQVSPFMPSDVAANEIDATYISPSDGYQGMPIPTQSIASDDVRQMNLDLPFITSLYRGQRIAQIMLKRAECEKTVVWPMNIMGLGIAAMDTVQLASTRYGLDNYAWPVSNWSLSADWGAVLSLREENSDIYADPVPATASSPGTIVNGSVVLTTGETQALLRDTYPAFGGADITAAESGGVASVTVPNFTIQYAGGYGAVSVTGTTIGSLAPSTTYYPYVDVAEMGDAAPTFGVTATYANALNSAANPLRLYLNQSVTTPASGSGGSSSGGGYGGGYGGGGAIP